MNIDHTRDQQSHIKLAFSALNDCNMYIDTIIEKANNTCLLYNNNMRHEADVEFVNIIELMDLYIQLISTIHKVLKEEYPKKIKKIKSLANLEIHLLSVLKAMLPAKEKNDIIMLSDLLQYELIDNLTQWKIQVIPELNTLRKN